MKNAFRAMSSRRAGLLQRSPAELAEHFGLGPGLVAGSSPPTTPNAVPATTAIEAATAAPVMAQRGRRLKIEKSISLPFPLYEREGHDQRGSKLRVSR